MEIGPEELRRQREAVARHLEWLDRKIAESTAAGTPSPHPGPSAGPEVPGGTASGPVTAVPASAPEAPSAPLPDQVVYESRTGDQIRNARIGCTVITIGAIALFVFLLFVLPYLLGGGDGEAVPEAPGATGPAE